MRRTAAIRVAFAAAAFLLAAFVAIVSSGSSGATPQSITLTTSVVTTAPTPPPEESEDFETPTGSPTAEPTPGSPPPATTDPSPASTQETAGPTAPAQQPAPPVLPATPPAVAHSTVTWESMAIAAGAIAVSLLILIFSVRRRPRPNPPVIPPLRRDGDRNRVATADVLDAMTAAGEAMLDSGYPVTVVRSALVDMAAANHRRNAEVVVFPTALMVSIDTDGGGVLTRAVSAGHYTYLLYQVDAVGRVVTAARARPDSARWARRRLTRIRTLPVPFSRLQRLGGYVLLSASISVLLGASWAGVALAALLGIVVGTLLLVGERVPSPYRVLVTVGASLLVSVIVFLIARTSLDPGVLPSLVAPLVILLPGGLLTTGIIELATGHHIAGAARLAAGGMRLILLALGIVAAAALVGVPAIDLTGAGDPLGPVAPWLAVAIFGVGIAVHQCARPQSIGWILLVLYVAYGAQVLGDVLFGGVLSALIGAVAMTPVAVIVARQRSGPPAVVSFLPAFWLLVPGALGLVGVTAILDGDATGFRTLVSTVATMVAIALGVLIGLATTTGLPSQVPAAHRSSI